MSFFNDDELDSLCIDKLILHVVGRTEDEFEPQPELKDLDNAEFFLERIASSAASSLHKFNDGSATKAKLQDMVDNTCTFEEGAQELSRRFAKVHSGNSSDGAFFVVLLSCANTDDKFYCLVKYDYREAVELYEDKGRNALRQIVQAFVKERSAIQKFCLVRVSSDTVEAEVSAKDRMGRAPDLTQYYEAFLDVERSRDIKEMSTQLNEAIRATLQRSKAHLPDEDVLKANLTVKSMLRGRETVGQDEVAEAVFVAAGRPQDEEVRAELDKCLKREFKKQKLDGIAFRPEQRIFMRPPHRKMETTEGVVLEYPSELDGQLVKHRSEPGGRRIIEIITEAPFEKDETVAQKSC